MKRIWAPWRMAYILQSQQKGCFLCDICRAKTDRRNLVLKRGESNFLLLNRYPYNNGHLLVAPYRHVDRLEAMTPAEMAEMMDLAALACKAMRKSMRPDGFNIGLNIGKAAGAGLKDHVHLHIVPRWEGDTNFMPVLGETKVLSNDLRQTYIQLREAIKKLQSEPNKP